MATIKAFSNLEQSKKLAEILPLESADMYFDYDVQKQNYYPMVMDEQFDDLCTPAWSLASLLGVLPKIINNETLFIETSAALWHIGYRNIYIARADNPVNACYEVILKLHELKML